MNIIKLKSLYSLKIYLIKHSVTKIVLIKSIEIIYRIFIRRLTTTIIFIIIIRSIYSPMRFPYKSIQTACHYKENPPVPIWRQKPYKCIGKVPYLELTLRLALRQGKTYILSSIRRGCLCRGLFTYLYFTNISVRCNTIKVLVLSALLYIRFLAPFLSFIYHLMYI